MRYLFQTRGQKYIKEYYFMSFVRQCGNKYGKKLLDTVTKIGIDAAKVACKKLVQETAETTIDLIGNKIADKITLTKKSVPVPQNQQDERLATPQHVTRKASTDYR